MNYFDSQFAVSQLNGNIELLCRLLTKFTEDYHDTQDKIVSAQAAGNDDAINLLVHTIKGVSGNLGMQHLHEHSKIIENNLKQSQLDNNAIIEYGDNISKTIAALRAFIDVQVAPQTVLSDDVNNEESIASLISVLQKNQFIPPQKLARYMQNVTLDETQKSELALAIQQLNYDTALSILNAPRTDQ